jgi:hypothetical protein
MAELRHVYRRPEMAVWILFGTLAGPARGSRLRASTGLWWAVRRPSAPSQTGSQNTERRLTYKGRGRGQILALLTGVSKHASGARCRGSRSASGARLGSKGPNAVGRVHILGVVRDRDRGIWAIFPHLYRQIRLLEYASKNVAWRRRPALASSAGVRADAA